MKRDDENDHVYGLNTPTVTPAHDQKPLDDETMGYAASLDWAKPTTEEHPTNKITDSHSITSSWWTAKPKGGVS